MLHHIDRIGAVKLRIQVQGQPECSEKQEAAIPGQFRLAGPIGDERAVAPVDPHEEILIREAFLRGATPELAVDWLWWRRDRTRPKYRRKYFETHQPGDSLYSFHAEADRYDVAAEVYPVVKRIWDPYVTQIRGEFNSLPKAAQDAFADPDKKIKDQFQFYFVMRPLYYNLGYSHPARGIFDGLQKITILGHPCIVHRKFAEFLADVESLIPAKGGLQKVSNDGGFVCRYIDDPSSPNVLSNHAFGLAIDFEAGKNPMIEGQAVITELNAIAREAGLDYQFDEVPSQKQDIAEAVKRSKAASDAVQQWVDAYLDEYEKTEKESHKGGPTGAAWKEQLKGNKNLARMGRLVEALEGTAVLKRWRTAGISSLDMSLVSGMHIAANRKYSSYGFRWGGEYESKKDFMHFEFRRELTFPPDASPRSLEALLGQPFILAHAVRDATEQSVRLDALTRDLVVSPIKIRAPR